MNYSEALKESGLLDKFYSTHYHKWGTIEDKQESFDLIIQAAQMEKCSPSVLGFTILNESILDLHPLPNTNGQPECIWGFDIGPGQINLGWCYRSVWVKEFSAEGLHFNDVFGKVFYEADGTPCRSTADPLANLRMTCRKLTAKKWKEGEGWPDAETKAVSLYCGPAARPFRQKAWAEWKELFGKFFEVYG